MLHSLKVENNEFLYTDPSQSLKLAESKNLDLNNLPKHIAFIMDGNGRWATNKGEKRTFGHRAGVSIVKDMVKCFRNLEIPVMTIYAFSTENWKRSSGEVNFLMSLFEETIIKECMDLKSNQVKIKFIGDIPELKESLREKIEWAENETKDQKGLTLNIATNYGGRKEIVNAVKNIVDDVKSGKISRNQIDEESFEKYLYTSDVPDPDLVIRTSGEMRISNYLLWQIAYSELHITETSWPDFSILELIDILANFQNRDRRFGGVK